MLNNKTLDNFGSFNDPLNSICSKEFVLNVLRFGSFLTIINNKRINSSVLFLSILENEKLRNCFIEITGAENPKDALLGLLEMYPSLVKSKNTKRVFKKSITN